MSRQTFVRAKEKNNQVELYMISYQLGKINQHKNLGGTSTKRAVSCFIVKNPE